MKWIKYFEEIQDLTRPNMEKKPFEQPTTNYGININRRVKKDPKMEWMEKWEIISFKYEFFKDDFRLIDKSHPEFEDCISDCIESSYKKDVIKINSVRRLQDGEVFTVGDVLCDRPLFDGDKPHTYGKIDVIWPSFDQMRADMGRLGSNLNNEFLCIMK